VAAAANLRPALASLAAGFEAAHPGAKVVPTYGASGALFAQIENGAPFDVFLSAEAETPRRLAEAGRAAGSPFTYATGRLVLWVPRSSTIDLERQGLRALLDPAIQKVAIANPAVAPYGAAAEAALRAAGVLDAVRPRLVLGQSVQQAAQFAQSGNAQAALLPLSLALAPPLADEGRFVAVPERDHPPIEQGGVVLASARDPALARAFAEWIRGPDGRALLQRSGYALPVPARTAGER
jgi:molybdate transport system substrate-binding protein